MFSYRWGTPRAIGRVVSRHLRRNQGRNGKRFVVVVEQHRFTIFTWERERRRTTSRCSLIALARSRSVLNYSTSERPNLIISCTPQRVKVDLYCTFGYVPYTTNTVHENVNGVRTRVTGHLLVFNEMIVYEQKQKMVRCGQRLLEICLF